MVNDAKIEIFSDDIKCDRYHLLAPDQVAYIEQEDIVHTEEGKAFTGFDNDFIINNNYDVVKNSRMARITLSGMNIKNDVEQPIYCLINDIQPLRNDKTYISLEPDSWMNYRKDFALGHNNTLYESTDLLDDYPYHDYTGNYKEFVISGYDVNLFPNNKFNILVLRHRESRLPDTEGTGDIGNPDEDWVYYLKTTDNFYMSLWSLFQYFYNNYIDTNEIVAIYLSPFELNMGSDNPIEITQNELLFVKKLEVLQYEWSQPNKVLSQNIDIFYTPWSKTVITDMSGATIWQSLPKDAGEKKIIARLEISFDECKWNCFITDSDSTEKICTDPSRKFSEICNNISFFADYYQQYQNLERNFNIQKRNAQYDKQQLDAIGDVVASTLWHGTSSGQPQKGGKGLTAALPQSSAIATGGAAIGGIVQIGIQNYSLGEYNKKLDDIENRQAKIQYDKYNSVGNSVLEFVTGATKPRLMSMVVDDETIYSKSIFGGNKVTYNCGIHDRDLYDILTDTEGIHSYISGDFDFIKIPLRDALQLNARFKTGVEFVSWK